MIYISFPRWRNALLQFSTQNIVFKSSSRCKNAWCMHQCKATQTNHKRTSAFAIMFHRNHLHEASCASAGILLTPVSSLTVISSG